MTLGDRVAVLRRGEVQQVGTPRELYNDPANLFVAGFIGSPSMNLLPAEVRGDTVKLPMVDIPLTGDLRARLGDDLQEGQQLIAGIRPENFEDASLVGDDKSEGATFKANIEVIEWMGAELFVHFSVAGSAHAELADLAEELDNVGVGGSDEAEIVGRLDIHSEAKEGRELELWIDGRRLQLFDVETGPCPGRSSRARARWAPRASCPAGSAWRRRPRCAAGWRSR